MSNAVTSANSRKRERHVYVYLMSCIMYRHVCLEKVEEVSRSDPKGDVQRWREHHTGPTTTVTVHSQSDSVKKGVKQSVQAQISLPADFPV